MKVTVSKISDTAHFKHELIPTKDIMYFEFHLMNDVVIRISTQENDTVLDINGDRKIFIEPRAANSIWIRTEK